MKDSFIFEGKKYISARRASEISDYSSDYVGQLCRAGKLDCRMVGRSWFVTEESLHLHKANVLHDEIYRNRIENLKGSKKKDAVEVVAAPVVPAAAPIESVSSASSRDNQISYSADDRPLLPVLSKGAVATAVSTPVSATVSVPVVSIPMSSLGRSEDASVSDDRSAATGLPRRTYADIARGIILKRALRATLALALLLLIGGTAYLAMSDSHTAGTVADESASLIDAVNSIGSFMENGYASMLALFSHTSSLSMNASQTPTSPAPGLTNGGAGENQGIAVVPSTGQPSSDEALKEKIQASFSDQVEVHPDQSGTTGVITPVFKTAKGKDFVYVMVPINSSPPQPSSQPPDTSSAGANL